MTIFEASPVDFGQFDNLPTHNVKPVISGKIRQCPADFQVTEFLSFQPSGEGEHLFLFIEKKDCNTDWLATELQKHFQLRSQDVGYAGKKDRYSISRQWFSLHLPGRDVSIENVQSESFKILNAVRHNKKLRKGAISHNHFKLVVRELSGKIEDSTFQSVSQYGFPNYFGYQRFGRNGDNLRKAQLLFNGKIKIRSRNKRGLYLSAARSLLFNLQVAERIKHATWDSLLNGDCLNLDGSQSYFVCEEIVEDVQQRLHAGQVHVSGWLAGRQPSQASGEALLQEKIALKDYTSWLEGLNKLQMDSARRSMRAVPQDLQYFFDDVQTLTLQFSLNSGCFATSLLRELFNVVDAGIRES